MKTDREIYTLLGADAETLAILTDGIRVRGSYRFDALEVKGLDRRTDGVLLPEAPDEPIWVIEFQAQADPAIYHRTVVELGLVGERHLGRVVRADPVRHPGARSAGRALVRCLPAAGPAVARRLPEAHP